MKKVIPVTRAGHQVLVIHYLSDNLTAQEREAMLAYLSDPARLAAEADRFLAEEAAAKAQ